MVQMGKLVNAAEALKFARDVATGLGRPGVGKCLLLPIVSGNFVRLDGLPEQCMQPLQAST